MLLKLIMEHILILFMMDMDGGSSSGLGTRVKKHCSIFVNKKISQLETYPHN